MLDRALELRTEAATAARPSAGEPGDAIAEAVSAYYDALVAAPEFVRLIEREALAGGRVLRESEAHDAGIQIGLAALKAHVERAGHAHVDAAQLILSIMALSWFALGHRPLAEALGLDPADGGFHERRKAHVVDMVARAII